MARHKKMIFLPKLRIGLRSRQLKQEQGVASWDTVLTSASSKEEEDSLRQFSMGPATSIGGELRGLVMAFQPRGLRQRQAWRQLAVKR